MSNLTDTFISLFICNGGKGVTSEPVPDVVGIQINLAFFPNSGI